ncbi:hypothetical protein HQ590_03515 [bacterium]|nr:hypothetical protein [bacterium]
MTVINISSIKDAVNKGTFIELSSDYRTASSVRAFLPREIPCAMSAAAFHQHVERATADERRLSLQRLCAFLSSRMNLHGKLARSETRSQSPDAKDPSPPLPLKLEWFAPDKYWVILMPDEAIQPIVKPA